jgi:hypothetical protein
MRKDLSQTDTIRDLRDDELDFVTGGFAASPFVNEGCIIINRMGPMPKYNPWLDPYSPQRRGA